MSTARTTPAFRGTPRRISTAAARAVLLMAVLPAFAADGPPVPHDLLMTRHNWLAPVSIDLSREIGIDRERLSLDRSRFVNSYWLPKMSANLSQTGAGGLATYPGRSLSEEVFYEDVSDRAFEKMHRATSRALKDYLMEETGISDLIGGVGDAVERSKLGRMAQSTLGIDLGVSHLAPEVAFRPKLAEGMVRVSVRMTGSVGFQYRTSRLGKGSRVGARLDPLEDKYTLNYLFEF
jgi:hypothetical protein